MPIPGRTDHIRAAVLTYEDVKNFLKYLRWLGYKFQYFVTGELGGLNHRAHWHIILHFQGRVPAHELEMNFSDRHRNEFGKLFQHDVCKAWPHGFMYWKTAKFEDVFYDCKYILKDEGDEASQRKPGMSKKPPIGTEYFLQWADLHVEQYLAPQALHYRFPEIKKKDGSPLIFMLRGRTAELFLERYIARWKDVHGDRPRPRSELVDLFEQYGKIVTDEKRMLIREEFPKGESREAIPTGKQIRASAEAVKVELEDQLLAIAEARVEEELHEWRRNWIEEATDEQERQRRQGIVEWEQFERDEEFGQYLKSIAKVGWQFIPGKGWVHDCPGPHTTRRKSFLQWRRDRGNEVAKQPRNGEQCEPLGPVGKFNRANGKGPGDGCSD